MRTLIEIVRDREDKLAVERRYFLEEQLIRRSLGLALWNTLCDFIVTECSHLNKNTSRGILPERAPESLTVRDPTTGRAFGLEYIGTLPGIELRSPPSSSPVQQFLFQVIPGPVPSLMMSLNGVPRNTYEIATELMLKLVNG